MNKTHSQDDLFENEPEDLTNRILGDYHVVRKIGEGAMAEVYLAQQTSLSRLVALKILKPKFAQDENGVKRFVREAKASARLVHPNIVHIYGVDRVDGRWLIAQEYVQGANLSVVLEREGPWDALRVSRVLWCAASALHKAARYGIVHRDIKPDNILIGDNGEIKVADFGLARIEAFSENKSALTQEGTTLGTPIYMSPEQAEGKPLDQRSDVYSLGITAYQLLCGSPPFRGETVLATALMHLNQEPEPLRDRCPAMPPLLAKIVHKMIEKSPDRRYQNPLELREDLKTLFKENFLESFEMLFQGDWEGDGSETVPANVLPDAIPSDTFPPTNVTRRLARTMKMESLVGKNTRTGKGRKIRLISWCAAAFLLGVLIAYGKVHSLTPEFSPPSTSGSVPPMNTIAEQWVYACKLESEAGWKSVIAFPNSGSFQDAMWVEKAKQQLALYYVNRDEPDKAFPIFEEFADQMEYKPFERAFGFAGLYWYYTVKDDTYMMSEAYENYQASVYYYPEDRPTSTLFKKATAALMRRNQDTTGNDPDAENGE